MDKKIVGNDKIIGRPIKLNRKTLSYNGKGYAEIVLFGDLHLGAKECDMARAQRMLDYCLEKNIYVFLMGDLLESGLRTSVGASVYEQKLNPQQQMDTIIDIFQPLADKKLILGSLIGNHELRIYKATGISVMKVICRQLKIPYLGSACWNLFKVGSRNYTMYALHGTSGSRFVYTKLKALVDISHSFNADILAMGHVHTLIDTFQLVQQIDLRNKMVVERKKFLVVTGHYLRYDESYAQEKGFPLEKLGSPKLKLYANKHDIHISS